MIEKSIPVFAIKSRSQYQVLERRARVAGWCPRVSRAAISKAFCYYVPRRRFKVREQQSGCAPRERLAFNVAIENPLIVVHGDTATSQVIFTEYQQEKAGDPMKFTT